MLVKLPVDRLDHMERIDHVDRIGEIHVRIPQILVVHIRDEIFYAFAFGKPDVREVGLCNRFAPAFDQVDGFVVVEVLQYQGILCVGVDIRVDFVDAESFRKISPFHVDMSGKDTDCVTVRDTEPLGNGCCT